MDINLADLRQRWRSTTFTKRQTFWIMVGVVILTTYLGFSLGGWVTGGTAAQQARIGAEQAVIDRLAPMCVAQFEQDDQNVQKLAEIKALTTSVQQTNYVKDGGWATMPGEEMPETKVATECASQLAIR